MSRVFLNILIFTVPVGLVVGCARPTPVSHPEASTKTGVAQKKRTKDSSTGAVQALGKVQPPAPLPPSPPSVPSGIVVVTPGGVVSEPKQVPPVPDQLVKLPAQPVPPRPPASEEASMSAVTDPRPGSDAIKRFRVRSFPTISEADSDENAISVAGEKVEEYLKTLDPPVYYRPTENEVLNEYVRKDSRLVREPNTDEAAILKEAKISDKRWIVEYDVEVTADQVRDLRTRDRVTLAMRVFGGLTIAALAAFLFLRADEFTKGYLTRWLAFAAVALAGGVVAALYFV